MASKPSPKVTVQTITVSELRAKLPEVLYKVLLRKDEYVITKHGQPFATLRPIAENDLKS